MSLPPLLADYAPLLSALKERVRAAQYAALKAVNTELVGLYWDIGRMLVERQAGDTWGKGVVQQLATDLQQAFPGVGGFSGSNLWRMRVFFEAYQGQEELAPLVREVSWIHKGHSLSSCARCSSTWPMRTLRSTSSCANKRAEPSRNTPCTMPTSPSAWPLTRSPARCRKTWPGNRPRPRPLPRCWRE